MRRRQSLLMMYHLLLWFRSLLLLLLLLLDGSPCRLLRLGLVLFGLLSRIQLLRRLLCWTAVLPLLLLLCCGSLFLLRLQERLRLRWLLV